MTWQMIDFLQELKKCFDIKRLMDYEIPESKSICLLRHDVDLDIYAALKIGKIEYSLGIQSTYFMLHDAKYYGDKDFIKNCLKLQDMGHEIGFHNNLLAAAIKTKYNIKDAFEKEINYLRNNNLNICGTAAHGDPSCRGDHGRDKKDTFTNYEIFKECSPPYRERKEIFKDIKLHCLNLSDYGLYEAYFLPRDYYITDCRGTWRSVRGNSDEWDPEFRPNSPKFEDILPFLKEISINKVIVQVLLHPNPNLVEV